jgi:hypothetical protein
MSEISLEKKITTKIVMGEKMKAPTSPTKLYSIIGICTGYKTGESNFGPWLGFSGMFEATRFSDGQVFASPVAFIPEPASSMMMSAIDNHAKKNEGQTEVSLKFAFIIGVKPSNSAVGYEYTVEPVLEASQADALSELRKQMLPRLPAALQPVEKLAEDTTRTGHAHQPPAASQGGKRK